MRQGTVETCPPDVRILQSLPTALESELFTDLLLSPASYLMIHTEYDCEEVERNGYESFWQQCPVMRTLLLFLFFRPRSHPAQIVVSHWIHRRLLISPSCLHSLLASLPLMMAGIIFLVSIFGPEILFRSPSAD